MRVACQGAVDARSRTVARPSGVEDDERHGQRLVLVDGMGPGVVELVQDVGADAAGAPLAVVRLGARRRARRVTSYGWISAGTPSNRMRRSRRTAASPTRRARSRAVSSSTIAPRNWLRTCSPRSATSRATARTASARALGRPAAAGPEQRREHGHPDARVGRLAVHHRARQHALGSWLAVGEQRRRPDRRAGPPGCPRTRPRARRARRPGTSRRLPEGEQHDLRERRQPVDRPVRVGDPRRPRRSRGRWRRHGPGRSASSARWRWTRPGGRARRREVLDVRPLVVDLLTELGEQRRTPRGRGRWRRRRSCRAGVMAEAYDRGRHPERDDGGPSAPGRWLRAAADAMARPVRPRRWSPRRRLGRFARRRSVSSSPSGSLVPRSRIGLGRARPDAGGLGSLAGRLERRRRDRGWRDTARAAPRPESSAPSSATMDRRWSRSGIAQRSRSRTRRTAPAVQSPRWRAAADLEGRERARGRRTRSASPARRVRPAGPASRSAQDDSRRVARALGDAASRSRRRSLATQPVRPRSIARTQDEVAEPDALDAAADVAAEARVAGRQVTRQRAAGRGQASARSSRTSSGATLVAMRTPPDPAGRGTRPTSATPRRAASPRVSSSTPRSRIDRSRPR